MARSWTAPVWPRCRSSAAAVCIAEVDGRSVAAGNDKLMDQLGVAYHRLPRARARSSTWPSAAYYAGHIVIADRVKPACSGGHCRQLKGRRRAQDGHAHRRRQHRWPNRWPANWVMDEVLQRTAARRIRWTKVEELLAQNSQQPGKAGLCGRRHQRCPGALPGGYRHRHGRHGLRCRHRGRRCGPDGRRPAQDRQGNQDLPQVPAHRLPEHRGLPLASSWAAWCWAPWALPTCGWPSLPMWVSWCWPFSTPFVPCSSRTCNQTTFNHQPGGVCSAGLVFCLATALTGLRRRAILSDRTAVPRPPCKEEILNERRIYCIGPAERPSGHHFQRPGTGVLHPAGTAGHRL